MLIGSTLTGLGGLILSIEKISQMSILLGTMLLWIGIGFVLITLVNMKTIKIDNDHLTIGTHFGLWKKYYTFADINAINPKSFRNKWKSYPGLIIKFRDERQVHIHEMEFKNFREIKKVITDRVKKYEKLEIEIWTPFTIGFLTVGGLIIIGLIILKAIEA